MLTDLLSNLVQELSLDTNVKVQACDVTDEDPQKRQLVFRCQRNGSELTVKFKLLLQNLSADIDFKYLLANLREDQKCPMNVAESKKLIAIAKKLSLISSEAFLTPYRSVFNVHGGSLTIEEDLLADKYKEVSETDQPSLFEIVRSLASFHAASAAVLRDETKKAEKSDGRNSETTPTVQTSDETNLSLPTVLSVGNFYPSNILMRYRGCGTWDIRFKNMKLQQSSPLEDVRNFVAEYLGERTKEDLNELLPSLVQSYYSRFYEVCDLLNLHMLWVSDKFLEEVKRER